MVELSARATLALALTFKLSLFISNSLGEARSSSILPVHAQAPERHARLQPRTLLRTVTRRDELTGHYSLAYVYPARTLTHLGFLPDWPYTIVKQVCVEEVCYVGSIYKIDSLAEAKEVSVQYQSCNNKFNSAIHLHAHIVR